MSGSVFSHSGDIMNAHWRSVKARGRATHGPPADLMVTSWPEPVTDSSGV